MLFAAIFSLALAILTLPLSKMYAAEACPIHPHCNDPLKANSVRSIRTDRQVLLRSVV